VKAKISAEASGDVMEEAQPPMSDQTATHNKAASSHFVIADAPIEPGKMNPMNLLTPEQLAGFLNVEVSWVYEQTRSRANQRDADPLPCIRMGKYLRFYWPAVERWLERRQEAK
jgi:hypothetical protein